MLAIGVAGTQTRSSMAKPEPAPSDVPMIRVRGLSDAPVREGGDYVLYWMIAARRAHDSFALDRAVAWARELGRPVLVMEPLRVDYRFASDRFHRFVIEGMADNAAAFAKAGVTYHPYVEREAGSGRGLLAALAERAAVVVTDDYPAFFLPRMIAAAAERLSVRLEAVDGNGLLPLRAAPRAFPRAYGFRRFLQRELAPHLQHPPSEEPFAALSMTPAKLPRGVASRWSALSASELSDPSSLLASLPIDHEVGGVDTRGGSGAARARLTRFLEHDIDRYDTERSHPDAGVESRLSSYLHFGHIASHRVLRELAAKEEWTLAEMPTAVTGKREGAWGMSAGAEGFLDQLVTWRELGYVFCSQRPDHASYEALPEWARRTLNKHAGDARKVYSREALEEGRTDDSIWNAAQTQLRQEGRIHNALRMLWGKRLLEWTRSPEEAHALALELNDRWATDGRDPNSISGIGWVFGLFDRAWGPEREIFGTVRYMSSTAQKRKLHLKQWLARFTPE